jgi:hypothetical protein
MPPLVEHLPAAFGLLPPALLSFPFIIAVSAIASVVVCLKTPPERADVLESFYRTVRPWGFWKPVHKGLLAKYPKLQGNNNLPRDAFNVAVGIIWQLTLNIIPICIIIGQYRTMWISVIVLVVTSVIMKFTWYDKLGPGDMYMPEDQ